MNVHDLAGLSEREEAQINGANAPSSRGPTSAAFRAATRLAAAQLRGALRARLIVDRDLISARGVAEEDGPVTLAMELSRGSHAFVRSQGARWTLAAMIAKDCSALDTRRVRRYVTGGFSLAAIGSSARARVGRGRCAGPFLGNQRELQGQLLTWTGGLAGVGLARATRKGGRLDPDDPRSFAIYTRRSRLSQRAARLGVQLTNVIEQAERAFAGALALEHQLPDSPFGTVVVWSDGGKVSSLLVNLRRPRAALQLLRRRSTADGVQRWRWTPEKGAGGVLDLGFRASLTLGPQRRAAPR